MLNAPPNHAGTHRGRSVPIQPSLLKMTYSGPMTTGKGIIIVASITAKSTPRPRQRIRENP